MRDCFWEWCNEMGFLWKGDFFYYSTMGGMTVFESDRSILYMSAWVIYERIDIERLEEES